jgi:hypothetical protein
LQAQPFFDMLYRRFPQITAVLATARESSHIIRERDAAAWPEW